MRFVYLLMAFVAGAMACVQVGVNNTLRAAIGGPVQASLVSFLVGTITLVGYAVVTRMPLPVGQAMRELPWWAWFGGSMGAFFVFASVFVAARVGAGSTLAWIIAGQLAAALTLDHFGVMGFAVQQISPMRLLGTALMVAGAFLIQKF